MARRDEFGYEEDYFDFPGEMVGTQPEDGGQPIQAPPPAPTPQVNPNPKNYSAAELDFLRRNPGDEARMKQALGNDTSKRHFDSQSDYYDQATNQLSEKGRAAEAQLVSKPTQLRSVGGQNQQVQSQTRSMDDVMNTLKGLFPGGAFNQDIVNRRSDNARDAINSAGKRTRSNNQAMLASRGLIGDGPEMSAHDSLDERLLGAENSAVNDIYARESENADSRMMQALQLAAGMSTDEARLAIDQFRANTDRDLGYGNLALGNKRADNDFTLGQGDLALGNQNSVNSYNLGLGNLGIDRDRLLYEMESGDIDQLMAILQMIMSGAQVGAGGFY